MKQCFARCKLPMQPNGKYCQDPCPAAYPVPAKPGFCTTASRSKKQTAVKRDTRGAAKDPTLITLPILNRRSSKVGAKEPAFCPGGGGEYAVLDVQAGVGICWLCKLTPGEEKPTFTYNVTEYTLDRQFARTITGVTCNRCKDS